MNVWHQMRHGPWSAADPLPKYAPDAQTAERNWLPPGIRPVPDAEQVAVFDPAVKHYARALRPSEPRFDDTHRGGRWFAARRRAIDHVVAGVAGSPWVDNLMLRGSMLLYAWYGSVAREPGDLDFVLRPQSWGVKEERTDTLLTGVAQAAEAVSREEAASREDAGSGTPVLIDADDAVWSDIWTYDRVPGRRVILPWTSEDAGTGTVQLDFVFNERLPAAPEFTGIPALAGGRDPVRVLAATPELSLAWKLLWLTSDSYPEGKDLFDACLLADRTTLSADLLRKVFDLADEQYRHFPVTERTLREELEYVEWDEFRKDRPDVAASPQWYIDHLAESLRPTFEGR